MNGRWALALGLAGVLSGCAGGRSMYDRSHTLPGELVWRYEDRLVVVQAGKSVAATRDWGRLSHAVACVPEARQWADSAASRDVSGTLLTWTGAAVFAAGVVGGTALALSDSDQALTGLALLGGGIVIGLPVLGGGTYLRLSADARGIDAVNRYNDEVWRGGCSTRLAREAAAAAR